MSLPPGWAPRRVLVLRPRGLGDIVLSSAVIDALRRAWPAAAVDFLAERAAADLLVPDERLDGVFLIGDARPVAGAATGGFRAAADWIRARRPDLVLDLFSNPRTAALTALSGARFRAGLDKRLRRLVYNVRVRRFRGRPEQDHRWARDVQLDFLRAAGITWPGEPADGVVLTDEDRTFASGALSSLGYAAGDRFAAVLPGGSWESKRWSVEGFVEAGKAASDLLGSPTLVVWGPPEEADARAIAAGLGTHGRLAPPSRLRGMAALLGRPAVLVSTDCLGRHFSVVQGVPTVGVFGTTDPRDWTPPSGPHRTVQAAPGTPLRALPGAPVVRELAALLAEVDAGADGP